MNPQLFQAYIPVIEFDSLAPLALLLTGGIACLVADAASSREGSRRILPVIAFLTCLISMVPFFKSWMTAGAVFLEGSFRTSGFTVFGGLIILLTSLALIVMSPSKVRERDLPSGEYYSLILFAAFGMVALAAANELLTAFICIEILSLALYVLAGIDRRSMRAAEASFKYFVLGAFASAFFVMGIAFLYGATGTTRLDLMATVFGDGGRVLLNGVFEPLQSVWVYIGFALLFVGLCFKLSLAPFHMWAPDVYEGASTPITMYIATASKVGAFALLFHVLLAMAKWGPFYASASFIMGLVAVASMLWGNTAALVQTNVKRMLAYSSIAHGGYMLVGFVALMSISTNTGPAYLLSYTEEIERSLLIYLFGYTVMNVLAFGIVNYLGKNGEGEMKNYAGLWKRSPMAAAGLALAMISLTGIPGTVGFMGKFFVFRHAVQHGQMLLAVIGVLLSAASAFYYLRLIVTMFMTEETSPRETLAGPVGGAVTVTSGRVIVLGFAAALVFAAGIYPVLLFALAG